VPGAAGCTARRITGWRLDAYRLAAVTAVVAPGIPVIDANTGSDLAVEALRPERLRLRPQPADNRHSHLHEAG
jgi:hypothetical protein